MRTLKLKEGIIYGPVSSRRLGSSLGVNLMPGSYKLCTFNCLYCHFGWTKVHSRDVSSCLADFPSVEQVREALEGWLSRNPNGVDYVTFSGNGEPCLHPEFDKMVEVVLQARDKYAPKAKVTILSNSTCLDDERVMSGLRRLDVRIMKLDAGSEETFQTLNRPCTTIQFQAVIENLKKLDEIIIQSVFVQGRVDNTEEGEVGQWIQRLSSIKPREVQIYSIDRPSADQGLDLVSKDRLNQIAKKAEKLCGFPVKVF
ncbi:MAG: radical SAM protein [Candidatus Zixiibacteriota bacterium]|nr:MAG: radical SAM protein [candidate division Zixibacteria bacterium]